MAEVTVCVPAYKASGFIGETLRSLQAQDFQDFIVSVAVEPADSDTYKVCREFLSDSRFEVKSNERVLGWSGNINGLLNDVSTPFFSILPHDDLYQPSYLSTLVRVLKQNPEASLAYTDSLHFGSVSNIKRLQLAPGSVAERLLAFFLGGAEAVPWRGVARKRVISSVNGFPDNCFGGFAVESEWALNLILQGQAIHVGQPLYLKRHFGAQRKTISWEWMNSFDNETIVAALEHHREKMAAAYSSIHLAAPSRQWVDLAFEVAMLRRHVRFCRGRIGFSEKNMTRISQIRKALENSSGELVDKIRSRLDLSCSINAMVGNDLQEVQLYAESAVQADADNWEAHIHLARIYDQAGDAAKAYTHAIQANRLEPNGEGIRALLDTFVKPGHEAGWITTEKN